MQKSMYVKGTRAVAAGAALRTCGQRVREEARQTAIGSHPRAAMTIINTPPFSDRRSAKVGASKRARECPPVAGSAKPAPNATRIHCSRAAAFPCIAIQTGRLPRATRPQHWLTRSCCVEVAAAAYHRSVQGHSYHNQATGFGGSLPFSINSAQCSHRSPISPVHRSSSEGDRVSRKPRADNSGSLRPEP
jgi:hypothetical protein